MTHPRLRNNGYVRSPADHRDYQYGAGLTALTLPSRYEVDRYNPLPVYDQGEVPACAGWMMAQMKTVHERKDQRRTISFDGEAFYNRIALPGGGAYLRDAFHVAKTEGVPSVRRLYKIKEYAAVNPRNHLAVKSAIKNNRGVVIGFGVTLDWMSDGGKEFKVSPGTDPHEVVGGHGMYVSGYFPDGPLGLNSWGSTWSEDGRKQLSWDYWDKNVWECWTITDVDD